MTVQNNVHCTLVQCTMYIFKHNPCHVKKCFWRDCLWDLFKENSHKKPTPRPKNKFQLYKHYNSISIAHSPSIRTISNLCHVSIIIYYTLSILFINLCFVLVLLQCDVLRWEQLQNVHFSRSYNSWTNNLILILKTPTCPYSCPAEVIICIKLV